MKKSQILQQKIQKRKKKKLDKCFICKEKEYFTKNFLKKRNRTTKMIQQLQATVIESQNEDVNIESLYSEQEEPDKETIFCFTSTSLEESEKETKEYEHVFKAEPTFITASFPPTSYKGNKLYGHRCTLDNDKSIHSSRRSLDSSY